VAKDDLKTAYKTIMDDHFPPTMEISFVDGAERQTLVFEKASWLIDNVEKGLRYGENPGQEAALYRLTNGNLQLGEAKCIRPGRHLSSDVKLLQSGKHPGKTNITDADNALNILRYLMDTPCVAIMKHNNPCGVAKGKTLLDAYQRANMADRLAAFGGAIALNREVDTETAEQIIENYAEVVVAPEFAEGVMDIFARKKNLRVMKISNMQHLAEYAVSRFIDFKSLIDGGVIAQWSFIPDVRTRDQLEPARATHKGNEYTISRQPTDSEFDDILFGWMVETGVTSNSVIYVKDGVTVGIGTGEQDRVGVAEIARDKAYRKLADRISWENHAIPYNLIEDPSMREAIDQDVAKQNGGIKGSVMVSDAFFPFRDGVDVGIREGVTAIVQPGGALRDYESIEACNDSNVAMVFTGQRSFKH
jgi:phosphoribosylaminoimidazolecarboxamide formyltransferase/IMP cyclohydrolase